MFGKTQRYCGKCKNVFTKTSLSELEAHVAVCDGNAPLLPPRQAARQAAVRLPIRARDLVQKKPPVRIDRLEQNRVERAAPPPPVVHPVLNDHIAKFAVGPKQFCGLVVDMAHLKEPVLEAYENPDLLKELEDVSANELLEMQKKATWDDSVLCKWMGWGDSQAFKTGDAMVSPLKTVVEYSENDKTASKDIKPKLRYVTKALRDPELDGRDVLCMLACHGGLCHVQKEIGVRMAYASLNNTLKSEMDVQNPRNGVLRLLTDAREACIENLYRSQYLNGSKSLNSHGLIGYRNMICEQIGLVKIPDQHAGQYPVATSYVEWYFERFYHIGYILDVVWKALDERKLNYNAVVSYLQYNRPVLFAGDAEEFLFNCFDANGKFTRSAAAWMLWKFGVFKPGNMAPHLIEKELFPPLPPDVLDEVRRSRDLILSGGAHDNNALKASKEKGELIDIDQIRASADALRNHRCEEEE